MRLLGLISFMLICFFKLPAQTALRDSLFSKVTTAPARAAHYKYLVDTTIKLYFSHPLNEDNEGEWNEALWGLELLQYKTDFTTQKLTIAWNNAARRSDEFQRNLLETTYALYTNNFKPQVLQLMQQTKSTAIFLRCAEYLLKADSMHAKAEILPLIQKKFPADTGTGIEILKSRINAIPQALPPLSDIFSNSFLPGKNVVYSLQRSNRNYAGLVLIRKPDGSFLKDSSGSFFHTAQLAKAISAYPFYITNGNTPQGILRFSGFDVSRLLFIGPTTNIQMQLPFETTPALFFDDSIYEDTLWSKELYASLLPSSWKNYNGMYESFYAGKMGRSAVIMHGTTIDPEYYRGKPYYPQTPSLGCLCSYESWDSTGHRTGSNQQKIVDALRSINASGGYVVVINIDDKQENVSLQDVQPLLK